MKQGKDCSLILKYQGGKNTTTLEVSKRHKAMAPKLNPVPLSSFQAEKMNKNVKRKNKNNLEKLLSYDQQPVYEIGLHPSRIMLQQSKQSNAQFKCDQCDFSAKKLNHLENHKKVVHGA